MRLKQIALGALVATSLVIGGGAGPMSSSAAEVHTLMPADALRHSRDALLSNVLDLAGEALAGIKQL